MNIDDVMKHLTPGELDAVKQAYRQGFDWRKTLRHTCSRTDTANLDEIERALEEHYFTNLSRIARFEGQGQPVPPKGGQWIDDKSQATKHSVRSH